MVHGSPWQNKELLAIELNNSTYDHRVFGTGISLNCYDRIRKSQSLESLDDAKSRTEAMKTEIKQGTKRKHDHVGPLESYKWKSEECYQEVLHPTFKGKIL